MGKRGETCLALDLGDQRRQARLTVEQLAEKLECEPGHIWKVESRHATVTLAKAIKAAAILGPLTVHLPGVGNARVIWLGNLFPLRRASLVPAEAAWLAREQIGEALEHLAPIQRAIMRDDRQELVHIARECVVEPKAAINELEASLNRHDPTVMQEAQRAYEATLGAGEQQMERFDVWESAAAMAR